MTVTNTTSNRGFQLPDPSNQLDVDVLRLIAAINGIDVDIANALVNLGGKANAVHGHAIADVSGLQAALDSKLGAGSSIGIANVTGLQGALDAKAPINNATFTGTTSGVTPATGANNTQFATTAWVRLQGYLTSVNLVSNVSGVLPVANGGTGGNSAIAARASLDVPTRTGGDASGTWGINISGTAANATAVSGATSNGYGTRTVSTSDPTGGANGDIWLKV